MKRFMVLFAAIAGIALYTAVEGECRVCKKMVWKWQKSKIRVLKNLCEIVYEHEECAQKKKM